MQAPDPTEVGTSLVYVTMASPVISVSKTTIHSAIVLSHFFRATAVTAVARLSHRSSVCPSVCPSVWHTCGSVKNGAS